jgi:tetraacyldisaccharide 4'-kinase
MFSWLRILAILLFPFPIIYTFLVYLRNKLYDWGWFKAQKIPVPVISIGNIQLGGTGKTPLVQFIVEILQRWGYHPVILTRGYKRQSRKSIIINKLNRDELTVNDVGDEPFLMSRNLPEVMIAIDANRWRAAMEVLKKNPGVIFILDDGFQHRQLQRDLDLVLLDYSRWSRLPFLFPLTSFRDVGCSLKRAHALILTHREENLPKSEDLYRQFATCYRVPIFAGKYRELALQSISDSKSCNLEGMKHKNVAAFCGIAHPASFFSILAKLEMNICWRGVYRDHFAYRKKDIHYISQQAELNGAEYIITTQKDAVKLAALPIPREVQWYFLRIKFTVEPESEFITFLQDALQNLISGKKINKKKC